MFERFTDRARGILADANRIAADLKSPAIRRHHLLIALIDTADNGPGSVAAVLDDAEVDRAALRAKLMASVTSSETASDNSAKPFTAESKKALEVALREALSLGHNYIGREHLLLSILRTADGPLQAALADSKLTYDRARDVVMRQSPPSGGGGRRRGGARGLRLGRRSTDGLQAVLRRTFDRADKRDATTGDLLAALLATPGTHFEQALAGVALPDRTTLINRVEKLIKDAAPDGTEGDVLIDEGGAVLIKNARVVEAVKKIVGDKVTPEAINEILRRLEG